MPETRDLACSEKLSRVTIRDFERAKVDGCPFGINERRDFTPSGSEKARFPISGKIGKLTLADMKPAYVYFLADPRTPRTPRYVGVTTNVANRAKTHASLSGANHTFYRWKCALRADGVAPRLIVVAEYPGVEAGREAEWRLIRRWQRRGFCDCNAECGNWDATKLEWAGKRAHGVRIG